MPGTWAKMAGRLGLCSLHAFSPWGQLGLPYMVVGSQEWILPCHFCHSLGLKQSEAVVFQAAGKQTPLINGEKGKNRRPPLIHHKVTGVCRQQRHSFSVFIPCCCCCSVAQSCPTIWNPMDCSIPGFPVLHHPLELAQTHVHRVGDTIQPSHPQFSPSPLAFNLSQHQGLFQWVSSSHQVARVLEFQLWHQFFQWIFRTDFL